MNQQIADSIAVTLKQRNNRRGHIVIIRKAQKLGARGRSLSMLYSSKSVEKSPQSIAKTDSKSIKS